MLYKVDHSTTFRSVSCQTGSRGVSGGSAPHTRPVDEATSYAHASAATAELLESTVCARDRPMRLLRAKYPDVKVILWFCIFDDTRLT